MAEFRMPALGADMDEGTLVEWLVKPGDKVTKGDIVAVVDTAKAAVEVECFASGTVEGLLVQPGERVPVGTVLATIAAGEEEAPARAAAEKAAVPVEEPEVPARPARTTGGPAVTSPLVRHLASTLGVDLVTIRGSGKRGAITRRDVERDAGRRHPAATPAPPAAVTVPRARATPYARRLARELGVDLDRVPVRRQDGVIRAEDVRAAVPAPRPAEKVAEPRPAAPQPGAEDRQAAMRSAIARLMARSKREIPHYYLTATVDFSAAATWLRHRNRELPVAQRLVPAALMLKATALAARDHPALNGFWVDGRFTQAPTVRLGVAVSLRGGGLVAPALHDAQDLGLDELMRRLRDLVARARAGRLQRAELADPTITVTNLGEQGVEAVYGVIYPPQVALVGFGKLLERPWAVDGLLGVRPVVTATLAADHRASDGYTGGRFLDTIDRLLQAPEAL